MDFATTSSISSIFIFGEKNIAALGSVQNLYHLLLTGDIMSDTAATAGGGGEAATANPAAAPADTTLDASTTAAVIKQIEVGL